MSILKREGEREREHLYPEDEVVLRPDDLASECGDGKRQVSDGNGLRAVVWGKDGGNGTCEEGEEDEEDEEENREGGGGGGNGGAWGGLRRLHSFVSALYIWIYFFCLFFLRGYGGAGYGAAAGAVCLVSVWLDLLCSCE